MMHVFASVNYNDTIEKIKHIKSENKKKLSKKDLDKPGAGRPGIALKSQRCTLGCSTRSTALSAPLNKPQNTPWSILG